MGPDPMTRTVRRSARFGKTNYPPPCNATRERSCNREAQFHIGKEIVNTPVIDTAKSIGKVRAYPAEASASTPTTMSGVESTPNAWARRTDAGGGGDRAKLRKAVG